MEAAITSEGFYEAGTIHVVRCMWLAGIVIHQYMLKSGIIGLGQ